MPPKNQIAQQIKRRKAPVLQKKKKSEDLRSQYVLAPQPRAVRATVPSSKRNQVLAMTVARPANSTGAWAQEFVLHPASIPWLAQIAPSYQRWGLQGLRVWYEPAVGTNTNGTVSMAILSDFKDATPTSLQSLTSVSGAIRGAPWDKFTLSSPKYKAYDYVGDFTSLSQEEKNARSPGRIVVVVDMSASSSLSGDTIGRIFLEYSPVLQDPVDPNLQ